MKTNFENIGGSYSQQGDYLLPNLTLLDENQRQISVWAIRHRRYLKSSHRVLYYNLLTSGKRPYGMLYSHSTGITFSKG